MGWPFAHFPETLRGSCSTCGRAEVLILVRLTPPDPPGSFVTLCWPCLGRDGDPLHRLR